MPAAPAPNDNVNEALRISRATIEAAASRIAPHIIKTPLIESPRLNDKLGIRLLVKAECLQHTGSFKLRGASNAVWSLDDTCLLYTSPSPRDKRQSRMPSSA